MTRGQPRMRGTTLRSGRELSTQKNPSATSLETDNISLRPGSTSPTNTMTSRIQIDDEDREHDIITDDPEPVAASATSEQKAKYEAAIQRYTTEMYDVYVRTKIRGDVLWKDIRTAFRPYTIMQWSRATMTEWKVMLMDRGIYVSQEGQLAENLIDVLQRQEHKSMTKATTQPQHTEVKNEKEGDNLEGNTEGRTETSVQNKEKRGQSARNTAPNDPDDDGDSSSDDEEYKPKKPMSISKSEGKRSSTTEDHLPRGTKALGLSGLIKAFTGQQKFSGTYEEDLDDITSTFETYATMCQVTPEEKLAAIPIMLKGIALSTYTAHATNLTEYEEAKEFLNEWFSSPEKQSRLLKDWQEQRLSIAMEQNPNQSEMSVFKDFTAKLMRIQKQLHSEYHSDRQLRDQLMTSIDIAEIQNMLRDRVPRTSQQLINRAATRMSEKPKTAGAMIADTEDHEAMYSLGQKYGGKAKRNLKGFQRQRPNMRRSNNCQRRISPQWMRGVKGCFVCGKDHRANEKHKREEVTEAVRRLKQKHPSAWITVEDLAYITEICGDEEGGEIEEQDEDINEWDTDENEGEGDLTYLADSEVKEIEENLSNATFIHGRTIKSNLQDTIKEAHYQLTTNEQRGFEGVRLDTCANKTSVMSMDQYGKYCGEFGIRKAIRENSGIRIRGIGGMTETLGSAEIQIPFKGLGITIDVNFALMPDRKTPSLLSMKDMKDNGLEISIQKEQILFMERKHDLTFDNYFLIHTWTPADVSYAMYTEGELRRIHRNFGHPSTSATRGLLKRANEGQLNAETKATITKIQEGCKICNRHGEKPRRFKLTMGTEELKFNHEVEIDTMFINSKPVLHMIDKATHFTAATFLPSQSTRDIWKAIQNLWNYTYLGPPDHIRVDQGTAYVSKEMRSNLEANGVQLKEAPIENPGTIGTVERYHAPLRAAYNKIRAETRGDTTDKECLKMAVYAINATMGPEGLCPMLLVFGAMPRPARTIPCKTQLQRARAIESAMKETEKEQTKRRIAYGLKQLRGPKANEDKENLGNLPPGANVLVYRTRTKKWEGPYKFISVEGETAIIQTERGRNIYRTTCIKPYNINRGEQPNEAMSAQRSPGRKSKAQEEKDAKEFSSSRAKELRGLAENGTFNIVKRQDIPEEMRIYGSRFIDQIKKIGTNNAKKKSRLVAQNYSDLGSTEISTSAPTIQRFTQRMIISIITSTPELQPFIRDVTQAYTQSTSNLERPVYIRPPKEMDLPEDCVLQVMKPLYGIPESGLHWYLTYLDHHLRHLDMTRTTIDPCLLVKRSNKKLEGLIAIQVDDTLGAGTETFLHAEEEASKQFKTKPREHIRNKTTTFNGIEITSTRTQTTITQNDKIQGLKTPTTKDAFASERAKVQYIGVNCRPDVCAATQLIAPTSDPTPEASFKSITKTIRHLQDTNNIGLTYVKLNMEEIKLVVLTDASFGNAEGSKSQLGYLIVMMDNSQRCNLIHYGSNRCKRVTRSVMAAELHALILGFDFAYVIRNLLEEILDRNITIEAYIDSKTVFDIIAKDGRTTERRLQIDVCALKESYEKGELTKVGWIPGEKNPADALTKETTTTTSALWKLLTTNTLNLQPQGWSTMAKVQNNKKKEAQVSNTI